MNNYIKQLVEAFDFNSVKKLNKPINVVDTILQYIQPIILKIDERENLSLEEYNILTNYVGIYKVSDKDELGKLISYFMRWIGKKCNLNWINVSNVTDMSHMFDCSMFNGDISQWDVSNVTDMSNMFLDSNFNGNISKWNVSNVTDMSNMFSGSNFNKNISKWNVSNVTDMHDMFYLSKFNKDISKWDVSSVTDMDNMFTNCPIKKEYIPKDFQKRI